MIHNDRKVYVKICSEWHRIPFLEIKHGEPFILCESDGTPVGFFVATSEPYLNDQGIGEVKSTEIMI